MRSIVFFVLLLVSSGVLGAEAMESAVPLTPTQTFSFIEDLAPRLVMDMNAEELNLQDPYPGVLWDNGQSNELTTFAVDDGEGTESMYIQGGPQTIF